MPKMYLSCRSTGRGAYTSMGGEEYDVSRTGNHWEEVREVEVGDIVTIVDISNSGKHSCHRKKVVGVDKNGEPVTEMCDRAWDHPGPCPICKEEEEE